MGECFYKCWYLGQGAIIEDVNDRDREVMDICRGHNPWETRQGQPRCQVRLVKRLESFVNKLLRILHLRIRASSDIEASEDHPPKNQGWQHPDGTGLISKVEDGRV